MAVESGPISRTMSASTLVLFQPPLSTLVEVRRWESTGWPCLYCPTNVVFVRCARLPSATAVACVIVSAVTELIFCSQLSSDSSVHCSWPATGRSGRQASCRLQR
eukprot:9178026-Pyramimonas_sp.AAC.1